MISPLAALIRLHEITLGSPKGVDGPRSSEVHRLLQALTPALHQRYLNTYRKHGARAVVPLERGVCSGCHMKQQSRPSFVDEGVQECQHCGRLVYDQDLAFEYSVG